MSTQNCIPNTFTCDVQNISICGTREDVGGQTGQRCYSGARKMMVQAIGASSAGVPLGGQGAQPNWIKPVTWQLSRGDTRTAIGLCLLLLLLMLLLYLQAVPTHFVAFGVVVGSSCCLVLLQMVMMQLPIVNVVVVFFQL